MKELLLFLLVCDITVILAQNSNPFRDPNTCGLPTCNIEDAKFHYFPSIQHTYKYSVEVRSLFNGTSKNESSLSFESVVDLKFLTPCEGIANLRDTKLVEGGALHPQSKDFQSGLSQFHVRFSFHDGIISEICPDPNEKIWVLNIKRGLLSMLYNSMGRFDLDAETIEEDVKGKCQTKYEVRGSEGTSLVIKKTKDLSSCTSRSKLHSVIQSVPYSFRSKIQPEESLLKSSSECILLIDHHIYKSVKCEETYLLEPFSNRGSGVTTTMKQNLILIGEKNTTTVSKEESVTKRVPLLFDHTPSAGLVNDNLRNTKDLVLKMCSMDSKDDHIEFSDVFTDLIESLRLLTPSAIQDIYDQSASICPTGRKNLLDAIPYVGNTAAFMLMKDIILKNLVKEETLNEWMFFTSLTRHPDEMMMAEASQLLRNSIFNPSIVLSVGALTHTFCSQHRDCEDNSGVQSVIGYLENQIKEIYQTNTSSIDNHDKMVVFLKSLGNAGQLSLNFKKNIIQIIEDEMVSMEIRVAAIECHRRIACDSSREYFEELYRNATQDPELRISAYLQIMRCPNYLLIRTIRHTLENEEVNQVGSFVWSHLNNLLKSSVPSRVEIQGLLSDKDLGKKYSADIRKFSHNYEGSLFFDKYNIGGNYDSNLIFSPKSYIPSSISLNITVDVFGESINLFEISGRMQGFENYLESIFGSKGPWSSSKLQDKIPKMRFIREIGDELLKSQIETLPNLMSNQFGDPRVSLGLRIFGNDLKYVSYNGYDEIKEAIDHFNPVHYLKKFLSNKEINYHKAMMFLDSSYTIPNGAGLPISLSAVGTFSLNMKLFGTLKADDFSKKKEFYIQTDLKPTASLDITGGLTIDAFYAKTGLKVKTSVYSSSALEGHISAKGFKLAKVKISIPQEKSEIFNSRSILLVLKHGREESQDGLKENIVTKSMCSWSVIDKTLGLKTCMEYHYVNVTRMRNAPYFIFAGSAGFRIFLEKLDPKAKDFIFDYRWVDGNDNYSTVSVTFDAPGSSLGRIVAANLTMDNESKNVTVLVRTTTGTLLAHGKYKNTPDEKYIQLDVNVNDFKHFDTILSLRREPINHGFIYYPKFYLGVNNDRVVEVKGTVKFVSKLGTSQYGVDLKFQTKRVTAKLFGYVSQKHSTIAAQLRMMYKFPKDREHGIDMALTLTNKCKGTIIDIQGSASLESTSYPHYDFNTKLKLLRGHAHTQGAFNITFNHKDIPHERTTFGLQVIDKSLDEGSRIVNMILTLRKPVKNIDINADLRYQSKSPHTNIALIVDYGKQKQFSTTVLWYNNKRLLRDIKLNVNVTVPTFHPMLVDFKLHERVPSHYNIYFNGTWFSGHSLSADGFYYDKSTSRTQDYRSKLLIKSPSFQDVFSNLQYYRDRNELKVIAKFNQNKADYMVVIKHVNSSPEESTTLARLMYHDKIYSILTTLHSGDYQHVSMEIHIDQMRDINFAAWAHNKESYKAAGIEVKWDANRDPDQKLVLSGNFTKRASFDYIANMLITYPGRTLLGNYEYVLQRGHLNTLVRISWDDNQSFAVIVNSNYNFEEQMYFIASSEIVTPFEHWQQTFINAGFEHLLNMYSLNGSLEWKNQQHVSLDIFGNYSADDDFLECKYRSILSSTLKNIPSLSAILDHSQNNSKIDTGLRIQYNPEDIIDIKSKWEVVADSKGKNYTGTVIASTPFYGFNKGYLISKIMTTRDRYLRGVADLDFDFKKFSISAEGRLKKLTNSMLVVNITTPLEKYSTINGKFGFIEDERYLVAMVTYPSKILGVEALLSIQSLTEFDIKFILGTPLDVLQRVILIGKLKPHTADLRAGWNSLLGGFTGKWHYDNALDFEYSYIIYTPIENFEENSIILKVIMREGIDTEASIKLSSQKLGVKIFGETQPPLLKELGINLDEIYGKLLNNGTLRRKDTEELEDDELMTWSGLIEIDSLVYQTIKGTLDIDKKGPIYTIKSKLIVPDGIAIINDRIEYYGPLAMKNKLEIQTPYSSYKEIKSNYEMDISPGQRYIFSIFLNYQNNTELVVNEVTAKYILSNESNSAKVHDVKLHIETPIVTFLNIDAGGALSISNTRLERKYAANMYVLTEKINVALKGDVKINTSSTDGVLFVRAKTPSIYVPPVYLTLTKALRNRNTLVMLNLKIPEMFKDEVNAHGEWLYNSVKDFNVYTNVKTPFKGFEKFILGVQIMSPKNEVTGNMVVNIKPIEAVINSTFKNDALHSSAQIFLEGKQIPVVLDCAVIKSTPTSRTLNGTLIISNKQLKIHGNVDMVSEFPMGAHVEFIPTNNKDITTLDFKITENENSFYKFIGSVTKSENFIKVDLDAKVQNTTNWHADATIATSHEQFKLFSVSSEFKEAGNFQSLDIDAKTPFRNLETAKISTSIKRNKETGNHLTASFNTPKKKGNMDVEWIWLYLENMKLQFNSQLNSGTERRFTELIGFYANPNKDFKFLRVGGNIDMDAKWSTGSNITIRLPSIQNVTIDAHLKLPPPKVDTHTLKGKLRYTSPLKELEFLAKYTTLNSKKNYASNGSAYIMRDGENKKVDANLGLEWAPSKGINNIVEYKNFDNRQDLVYKLSTPKYKNRNAIIFVGTYDQAEAFHNLTCQIFKPENNSIVLGRINFKELANMNGLVNITIPYENMNYAGVNFSTESSASVYNRYLEAFWPENSAKIDAKCDIETGTSLLHRTRRGNILVEVPIASRHIANIDYIYKESPLHSMGNATVHYNKQKLVDAIYDCQSESRAGLEKDTTHVEIRNSFVPVGANYIHGYEYGDPTAPTKDTKSVELYHLTNRTKFAIEGDLIIGTKSTGQQIGLIVKHFNKTIKLTSDYDILDHEYQQHSRLELKPEVWIEYNINLRNETVDQQFDAQRLQIDIQYPLRNFSAVGSYKIGEQTVSTDIGLRWDLDNKTVNAALDWKKVSETHEQVLLTLRHPTFEKDVTLLTEYEHDKKKIVDARLKFDYSEDPDQLFVVGGRLDDNSYNDKYNYSYQIYAIHNATNLELRGRGDFYWGSDIYSTNHYGEYKRSYLPSQISEAIIRLDLIQNEIELKREDRGQLSYLKASLQSNYPIYTGNLFTTHEYNEASGNFRIDLNEKVFNLDHNMNTDGTQNLHMFGDVPDARSAKFNSWRNYDDIRIDDITYFLKMNHSRLIVSNLMWRPNLLRDLKSGLHGGLRDIYNNVIQTVNNTRQYVRSEINETLKGIWNEAEPRIQNYLEDMRGLRIIEDDMDHFKSFLNASYHANDFYVKTIVTMTMYAFDELALKKHFESVPAIISEIWGIMGDSGKKLKQSIEWVAEKIKLYYKNITVFMRELLDGDPIQHLSNLFSNILEQYDDFIKKMHVAFIQYTEKLWQQTYDLLVDNWHKMLIAIEPTFLKLLAYAEGIAWSTSKNFLDFLYIRKNEIMESPYFAKFTNFTHDVDKFYKDIYGNNTLSSTIKYTKVAWNFFREKYMDKLPFAKELEAVIKEVLGDLNELRKLPSVMYIEERLNQFYTKVMWFYDYFEVESRLQSFLSLVHKKVTDYSQNALQAENMYRKAKTKFIFDPYKGQMLLEQKMPMSWHAFNETPNFQEIPEIKVLYDIQNFFMASRRSFWNFYYDYKPYTDPSEWLPPFKAQALIIGNSHYVTFDRKFYEFEGDCSYLLASDMKDHNFTLVVKYTPNAETHELLLVVNKTVVEINMFTDVIKIGNSPHSRLPVEIGDTFIHREYGTITVESASGFVLECNTKYHICIFEVAGWYFGKTAGLLGTINNELYDDFTSSTGEILNEKDVLKFAKSWTVNQECAKSINISGEKSKKVTENIAQLCDDLYAEKVSQFSSCFQRIPKQHFLDMCLESSTVDEACTSAAAYTTLCSYENTPLRMPDVCIKCQMPNGSYINEGEIATFTAENMSPSADFVFLVEAKECNRNLTSSKNMRLLTDSLEQELGRKNFIKNRYAVVFFGGDNVYGEPRVRSLNGEIFVNSSSLMKSLENIPVGNGSADIFNALIYASSLNFRPAVSKNFILFPCSDCQEGHMKYEYPILHQLLTENSITLHLMMKDDFNMQKSRDTKIPFGLDNKKAYTKKDFNQLKGDEGLRNLIKLPKNTMGLCIPLALETQGTLFTSKFLHSGKDDIIKKFISVYTKRLSAPSSKTNCMQCECTAPDNGLSYMECSSCSFPFDYDFDHDEFPDEEDLGF